MHFPSQYGTFNLNFPKHYDAEVELQRCKE